MISKTNENVITIELANLTKTFNGRYILNNVNYKFKQNCCYIIQGESGIGKTTLLNLINRYVEPDQGSVIIPNDIKVDYMFQDIIGFSNATVIENLALKYYANKIDENWNLEYLKSKYEQVLKAFNIHFLLNRKLSNLSGGEKQRVVLAGMIVSDADVLLLDEPAANLDADNRNLLMDMIELCLPNRTVIIVSHVQLMSKYPIKMLEIRDGQLHEK